VTFASPGLLAALAAVPLAAVAYYLLGQRARRHAVRFPGVPTLAAIVPAVPAWRRHLPAALFLLALAALIVALSRPQTTVAVPVERASVVLVTDVSRSMLADDVEPSRLDAARDAGERFLDQVPDALRIGSVTYADRPQIVESPSSDHDEARAVLDGLVADGGTATGDALQAALDTLDEQGARRPPAAIVLLSDGQSTLGSDPVAVARTAGRQRVPIYTIALGTSSAVVHGPRGELIPVPPDPEALRRIAEVSGGEAFRAQDDAQLDSVYERLGSQLGTEEEKREVTAGFAAGGAVLLLLAAGFSLRWTGRLP
jgi:Ca-activated chloride channel family protein